MSHAHKDEAPTPSASHVLVVDDDTLTRRFFRMVLEEHGYRVAEARDGLQALQQLAATPCWLVITDLEMPRMHGLQLIERIRRDGAATAIIAVSGCTQPELRQQAYECGATLVLAKPLELAVLETHVQQLRDALRWSCEQASECRREPVP